MSSTILNSRTICLSNQTSECETLFDSLTDYLQTNQLGKDVLSDLRLALEETFINIVSYAFPEGGQHNIHVSFHHDARDIQITFVDDGTAFNPLTDAAPYLASAEHSEGGMGIQLIRSLTDHQLYKRSKQTNVFILTKHYTKPEKGA